MANSNSEKIDHIVDPQVLKQLTDLDASLDKTYSQMGKVLKETLNVEKSLSTITISYQDLVNAINNYNTTQRRSNSVQNEQERVLREQERLRQRITNAYSEESMELERLRQLMQQISRTRRNVIREQNSQTGSLDQLRAQLNQVRQSWDAMSQRTRQSPIGEQALEDINRLNREITELEQSTGRNQRNVGNYLTQLGGTIAVFAGNMLTKAVSGLKDLISKGIEFIKTGIEIAGRAEGIERAFNKLNNPDLLSNLRTETKGLVSDFALMQTAVKANTFGIPLENLGKMLKFAQQRAQETGQSVDYLAESIINGIGRKSPLILDNLGISASRLSEEVKKSGDFAGAAIKIVNEELEKQGDLALTGADLTKQASVKWENAMLAIGKRYSWLGTIWDKTSGNIADFISELAGDTRSYSEVLDDQIDKVINLESEIEPLARRYDELKSKTTLNKDEQAELNKIMNTISGTIPGVVTEFDEYGNILSINTDKVYEYIDAEKARLKFVNREAIAELKKQRKEMQDEYKRQEKITKDGRTIYVSGGMFGGSSTYEDTSTATIGAAEKKVQEIGEQIDGLDAELARLEGATLDERVNTQKDLINKRAEFNAMNKKQLDAWIKDENNASNDYLSIAKQIYSQRFALTTDIEPKGNAKGKTDKEKSIQTEKKASQELLEFKTQQTADANKKVVDDDKQSYETRLAYLDDFVVSKKEAIELSRKNQLDTEGLTKSQIELINLKANAELLKIDEESAKIRLDLEKYNAEKLIKEQSKFLETRNNQIKKAEQESLLKLAQEYSSGLISYEQYEQGKIDISRETSKGLFDAEIEYLEKSLEITDLTAEQKEDIQKKLGEARIDYEKYVNDTIISDEEQAVEKRIELEKQLADKRKELLSQSLEVMSTLFAAHTDKQISKLDDKAEANSAYYEEEQAKVERLEEAGAITAEQAEARKEYLAEQEEARNKKLEEQKKEIMERQAKYDKAMSIARIGIDTATAIMKVQAQMGVLAAPLIPAIIASGAIQLTTVLATPIPEYAEGTDFHKGGFAIVGDGGKHEMIITPDNKVYKTPNTDTLVNLPVGTQVLPDFAKALENMSNKSIPQYRDDKMVILQENKRQISLAENSNALLAKNVRELKRLNSNQRYNNSFSSFGVGSR